VNRKNTIGKHGKVVQKHITVTVRVDSYYTLCNVNPDPDPKLSALCDGALRYVSLQEELCEISAIENLCFPERWTEIPSTLP